MPMTSTRYITTLLVMLATTGSHSQLLTTVQTVIGNGESSPVALVITEENGMADILSVVKQRKCPGRRRHVCNSGISCKDQPPDKPHNRR